MPADGVRWCGVDARKALLGLLLIGMLLWGAVAATRATIAAIRGRNWVGLIISYAMFPSTVLFGWITGVPIKAFIFVWAFLAVPFFLTFGLVLRHGQRHGWTLTRYRWSFLGFAIVFIFYFGWIMEFPVNISLWTIVAFGLPFALLIIGLARHKVTEKVIWSVAAAVVFFAIQRISLQLLAPHK